MKSMTHSLFLIATLTLALLLPATSRAQAKDEVYVMRESLTITGLLKPYDTGTKTCATEGKSFGSHAEVVIYEVRADGDLLVALKHNNVGVGMAEIRNLYCISKGDLNLHFMPQERIQVGVVTVPFKLRLDPVKIMAGGTLGAYVGKKFRHSSDFSSTLMGFASLTNVPLNDLNDQVPQTKWGLGVGAGWVAHINGDFQVGIVSGIDIFEGANSWPYKYKPWLSLSIGYAFLATRVSTPAAQALK